jgi:C4-dicarboxylate transporter DctQ subunit
MSAAQKHGRRGIIDEIEETAIAVILGLMTLITFANVIARYVFNSNFLWALELTVFLFAWLVLLGISYAVKKNAHLGVDALTNLLGPGPRRILALFAVACCLAYSLLLLKGSWDYWWKFATTASFLEVNDIPMPGFLQFLADWMNDGEPYEKLPRYIPYAVLPIGLALLTLRFAQAGLRVWRGETDSIIASHEAEDLVEEVAAKVRPRTNEEI